MGGWVCEQKKGCVPKMGLSFLALYSNFHFSPEEKFFGLGVGGSAKPPPPPRMSTSLPCALWAEH